MQAPQLSNLIEICLLGSEIKHAKKWTNMASDRLFVHGASKERITIFYCQSFQKMHYVNYIAVTFNIRGMKYCFAVIKDQFKDKFINL
jgi:hypothetical protein